MQFSRISSRFNPSRRHPVLNTIRAHRGVDYAAPVGTPVRAAGEGRVRFVGRQGGYGNVIELEHGSGVVTVYGHLSRFASQLRRGQRVELGKVIGYVGKTGLATGPHLHYEYRIRGVHKNPQTVPLPDAAPIPADERDRFLAATADLVNVLDLPAGPVLRRPLIRGRNCHITRRRRCGLIARNRERAPWTSPISAPPRTTSIASCRCSNSTSACSRRRSTKKCRCSSG